MICVRCLMRRRSARRRILWIELWDIGNNSVEDVMVSLSSDSLIEYAEPNYRLGLEATAPNDPDFSLLWGLDNSGQTGGVADADIDAPEAWDIQTCTDVVIGVIDTGIDYTHPDLVNNMWTNPGEIAGNSIDDDGNGYIDDVYGWDFVNNDNDPYDGHSHGTHVAGTIAGRGDDVQGVAGVNWSAQLMALNFLSDGGWDSLMDAVQAIEYATMMGAKLTMNSWGGGGY